MVTRHGRPRGNDHRGNFDVEAPFPTVVNLRIGTFDDVSKLHRCRCTRKDCYCIHRSIHEMVTTKGTGAYKDFDLYALFITGKF